MNLLTGKVAIITGASSGIGRASAKLFAAHGASVVLVSRRFELLSAIVGSIENHGGKACAVAGDVREEKTHEAAVSAALERFGGLDIGFHNAGLVGSTQPLAKIDQSQWAEVLATNLTGAFLGARAQIPAMLGNGGGSQLFTGSFVGNSVGLPGMAVYGTSKAALLGLVKGITADYGDSGIRANVIQAGGTETDMAGGPEQRELAAKLHAVKRLAHPNEIAQAALFLASEMASFVSGSAMWVDGGNAAVKT